MNRKLFLFVAAFLFTYYSFSQTSIDKALQSINIESAKANLYFLAADEMLGRDAGSPTGKIAAKYLATQLHLMGIQPLNETYLQPFTALQVFEPKKANRWQSHPDSVSAIMQKGLYRKLSMQNVLGIIPGKHTNEYVIVGAHFDHIGVDTQLFGDSIFNGADDNGSGVTAVLQIAKAFKQANIQPQRNVIFAFWDGEEKGLLGSQYFVATFPAIKQVKSYLNFDMIGRNNDETKPKHVVFFYTAAHKAFEQWLRKDIVKYKLDIEPDYRAWDNPVGGSDNGSFAKAGIPILWYHTDGHPDYHMPGDEPEKINWNKLVAITKAAFLNAWKMANEKDY